MKMKMGNTIKKLPSSRVVDLPSYHYCPNCVKAHEFPHDQCCVDNNGDRYVTCNQSQDFYPNPPAQIPSQQLNIIFQTTFIQSVYGKISEDANQTVLSSDFESDALPFYQHNGTMLSK